jgi:hypothetical protein
MAIFYTDSGSFGDITVSGSVLVSGTLAFSNNSGGLTGSLLGTASWANNAVTASYTLPSGLPLGIVSSSAQYPGWVTASSQIVWSQVNYNAGIVSSSTQVKPLLPIGTVTSSAQYPGWVTASSQIVWSQVNYSTGIVSSSTQVKPLLPADTVTSSTFTSPSQGTVRAAINGVNTDVDTGLQTGDSPSFTGLTLSSATNTTNANLVLVRDTGTGQIFTTASVGTGAAGSVPAGTISASVAGDAQGQIKLNNVNVNITGLQTTSAPSFAGLQITGSVILSSSNNNSPVIVSGSTDSFFELEVVNFSAGNNASSDIVVSSNNTTDAGNYIDLGINSTTYNAGLVGGPSDGYVYFTSSVGELHLGNASPVATGNVRLFAGGPSSDNTTRVFISSSGNVGINTTTGLRNTLSVNGSISASAGITGSFAHFNPVSLKITVGTTAPTSPAVNDLWVDTN